MAQNDPSSNGKPRPEGEDGEVEGDRHPAAGGAEDADRAEDAPGEGPVEDAEIIAADQTAGDADGDGADGDDPDKGDADTGDAAEDDADPARARDDDPASPGRDDDPAPPGRDDDPASPGRDDDPAPTDADRDGGEGPDEPTPTAAEALDSALATAPLIAGDGASRDGSADAGGADRGSHDDRDEHEDDDEDGNHRSLASRVLTVLVILIAGGALALWGAPRVAPHLPAALDPVKAYLLPGESVAVARIEDLEARLQSRIAALDTGPDTAEVQSLIAEATAPAEEARAALSQRLDALAASVDEVSARVDQMSDQVAAVDGEAVRTRLSRLETQIEGLAAEVAELETAAPAEGATLSTAAAEDLRGLRATVEGLRAETQALADAQGALSSRIDEVEASVRRRLEQAEAEVQEARAEAESVRSLAEARGALAEVGTALGSGAPFAGALGRLDANTEAAVPVALSAVADGGVATMTRLAERFPDAATAALKTAIREERPEGLASRVTGFLESQVATRSLTPREGDSTDAVLSRAEAALRQGDLDAALAELAALPAPAAAAPEMADWLADARARRDAVAAFDTLDAALSGAE